MVSIENTNTDTKDFASAYDNTSKELTVISEEVNNGVKETSAIKLKVSLDGESLKLEYFTSDEKQVNTF